METKELYNFPDKHLHQVEFLQTGVKTIHHMIQ